MPIVSRTNELFAHLAASGVAPAHAITGGVRNALGVWPGDEPSDDAYPVLGYHVALDAEVPSATVYIVTAGKFVRYEWSILSADRAAGSSEGAGSAGVEAAMTFVCGIDRVASVTEETVGDRLTVTVELDAQDSVTQGESQGAQGTLPGTETPAVMTSTVTRRRRARYELVGTGDTAVVNLAAFSLGLRTAMGV